MPLTSFELSLVCFQISRVQLDQQQVSHMTFAGEDAGSGSEAVTDPNMMIKAPSDRLQ